ncbi:kinase-like domain-containing protein [Mycena crocata]|nr:kinase-like domain-containing protein [Mycena crocata]
MYLSLNPTFISSLFDYVYAKIDSVKNAALSPFIEHTPNTSFILVASAAIQRAAVVLHPALLTIDGSPALFTLPPGPLHTTGPELITHIVHSPTWVPSLCFEELSLVVSGYRDFGVVGLVFILSATALIVMKPSNTQRRFKSMVKAHIHTFQQQVSEDVRVLFRATRSAMRWLFPVFPSLLLPGCRFFLHVGNATSQVLIKLAGIAFKTCKPVVWTVATRWVPYLADILLCFFVSIIIYTSKLAFPPRPRPVLRPEKSIDKRVLLPQALNPPARSNWSNFIVDGVANAVRSLDVVAVRFLGKGSFGNVLQGHIGSTGQAVAIKRISKRFPEHLVRGEIRAMNRLSHAVTQLIPTLLGGFRDERDYILVMEYLPGGTLFDRVNRAPNYRLSRSSALTHGAQMLSAIHAIHQQGILHRDLKPDNILLNAQGNVVVSDFGLSMAFDMKANGGPDWNRARTAGGDAFPLIWPHPDNPHWTRGLQGTHIYGAPEAMAGLAYSYGVDFWSFAVCFFELLTGELPFVFNARGNAYIEPLIFDVEKSRSLDHVALDFFSRAFSTSPRSRMSVAEMKRHPIWTNLDWHSERAGF